MLQVSFINQAPATARIPRAVIYRTIKKANRFYRGRLQAKQASLVFVSRANMRKLNKNYRRQDKATNVLSFGGQTRGELGDIIICPSLARREAAADGKSLAAQINYLFIHGLLHLLGFDHHNDQAEKLMRQAEAELM